MGIAADGGGDLAAVAGAAHPKAGGTLLPLRPSQIFGELRVGAQAVDGVEFPRQRRLGKHGVELAVAGGAEARHRPELAALRARRQMMPGKAQRLPPAKLAHRRRIRPV